MEPVPFAGTPPMPASDVAGARRAKAIDALSTVGAGVAGIGGICGALHGFYVRIVVNWRLR